MPNIFECWHCNKSLLKLSEEERKIRKEKKIEFHCSEKCQKECKLWNYSSKKAKRLKKNKCSVCKKEGHNKRTCKEIKK